MHRLLPLLLILWAGACADDDSATQDKSPDISIGVIEALATTSYEELLADLPRSGPVPFWSQDLRGGYVGSDACSECHLEEFELQSATRMHGTGERVTAENRERLFPSHLRESTFEDPYNRSRYRFEFEDNGVVMEVRKPKGQSTRIPVDWAIGAGGRAYTFVTPSGETDLLELRVSHYTDLDEWGVTPRQPPSHDPRGIQFGPRPAWRCFDCHATGVLKQPDGRLILDEALGGVQCERCHGPGGKHVEAMARGDEEESHLLGLQGLSGAEQVAFCAQCHRRIEEVDVAEIVTESASIVRHSGVGITLSACFLKSEDFGCLNCHSPHQDSVKGDAGHYDHVCAGCHPGVVQEEGHGGQDGSVTTCIGCHMQAVPTSMGVEGRESTFVDHWIRVPGRFAKIDGPEERLKHQPELADLVLGAAFQTLERDRENHMAFANIGKILQARGELDRAAWAYEQSVRLEPGKIPNIGALAMLAMQLRYPTKARWACQRILELSPRNDLATKLLEKIDRLEESLGRR